MRMWWRVRKAKKALDWENAFNDGLNGQDNRYKYEGLLIVPNRKTRAFDLGTAYREYRLEHPVSTGIGA